TSLATTPNERKLVSASGDGTVRVWDLHSEVEEFALIPGEAWINAVAVTVDGKFAIAAGRQGVIRFWDLRTGEECYTLDAPSEVTTLVATPDGQNLLAGLQDGRLCSWNLTNWKLAAMTEGHHGRPVTCATAAPRHNAAFSASSDRRVKVWNIETLTEESTLLGHNSSVTSLAACRQTDWLVSGSLDDALKVWDFSRQRFDTSLEEYGGVTCLAATSSDDLIVAASDSGVANIWSLSRWSSVCQLTGHKGRVNAIAVTEDCGRLISASDDETLAVWSLAAGRRETVFEGHDHRVTAVSVSLDSRLVISGGFDGVIAVWGLDNGRENYSLMESGDSVVRIVLTLDGTTAVVASSDGTVFAFEVRTGVVKWKREVCDFFLRCVATGVNSSRLFVGASDGIVRVLDIYTGECINSIRAFDDPVLCLECIAGGSILAAGSENGLVKVWEAMEMRERHAFHTGYEMTHTSFDASAEHLYSLARRGPLQAWRIHDGQCVGRFDAEADFTTIRVLPTCESVLAGDALGRLHLLRLEVGTGHYGTTR
ncbi:MAG: WD40 repeat domain-containing protein, partial [Planctomycetes bacterium]|nr:WD40 repeat domain-containing protein [Planctomycetota bacterium]